ncbi:GAF domain-containing protein [Glycocaulis profundi]|nr:GAF domain-containing protein [Glycocaulis profundi]
MPYQRAALPSAEPQRLRTLQELEVLDTVAEPRFDEIVRAAAFAFDTPTAVISLVDQDRQWFKARTGLSACETGREESFCSHSILQREPFVVLNASTDPRFRQNPLVVGAPFVRFYAGAAIIVRGQAVGAMCVQDTEPRFRFTDAHAAVLTFFAGVAADRLAERALALAA